MELPILPADEPAEQESAGGARDENVSIERLGEIIGLDALAPDLVPCTIIPDTRRNRQSNLTGSNFRRNDQRLSPGGGCAVRPYHCNYGKFGSIGMIHEVRRIDSQRGSDPVEPTDGDRAGPGFETTDGLRCRRGDARLCDVVQSHTAGAANLPNPRNHVRPYTRTNQ